MNLRSLLSVSMLCGSCVALATTARADEGSPPLLRCGSHCLYTALNLFDKGPDKFEDLETLMGQPTFQGYSLAEIQEAAEKYGLVTLTVSTTLENLQARTDRFACIAHINDSHFVLVGDVKGGKVSLIDPPRSFTLPTATFLSQWDGAALLLSDVALEAEESINNRRWRVVMLWRLAWCSIGAVVAIGAYRVWKKRTE